MTRAVADDQQEVQIKLTQKELAVLNVALTMARSQLVFDDDRSKEKEDVSHALEELSAKLFSVSETVS
jgi:hypothetical protein